ncbi:HAD hydrolase-like protein [Amycolatopsis sp. WAC 01375]|uniref:HAD hydrolase-like protein n=1 Tax=Amycolatopsis sp. WAC 01375 TaxID=2203194 RepID=UPI001315414C|nr:HAD hydrolase-like protein [Amycolatopsis sp. WAC 01375]
MLITVDVGHTLGEFDRPGTADVLREIAGAPTYSAEVDRTILHVTPELTPGVARQVRELLLIPDHAWPETWDTGGFTPYPDTFTALTRLAAIASVVALTNVSCIAGPRRLDDLDLHCGQHLDGVFASFQLGARKPQPYGWRIIAATHGINVHDIVHIGDRVDDDIRGALAAGCAAAILVTTRETLPADLRQNPRATSVPDLDGAATAIAAMTGEAA